jgi:hypothetical protein
METAAPPAAKLSAMERPMPRLPPATKTFLPVKSNVMGCLSLLIWRHSRGFVPPRQEGNCARAANGGFSDGLLQFRV